MSDYFYSLEELLHLHAIQLHAVGGADRSRANSIRYALYFVADENNQ